MTILAELVKLSHTIDLPAKAYAESTIYWQIILNLDGSFNRIVELTTPQYDRKGKAKKPKPGQKLSCPHIRRNAIQPKLITDTVDYVFGDGEKAQAYRALLQRCYQATQEPAVHAILTFLNSHPQLEELQPKQTVTFTIDQVPGYIHDLPAVQQFWARYVDEITASDRPVMQCLVTGEELPVTTKFSLQIKGVPGTNSAGASLISAYDKSCWSYGLSGALVSPISAEADEQFSQALSYLLRDDNHHINIGGTTFVLWADSGGMTRHLFETPSVETVRDYLNLFHKPQQINPDWEFNILALSGYTSRLVVRDWIHGKEPEFVNHYEQWLKRQEVIGWNQFDNRGYLGVWRLAAAGYREAKEIQSRTVTALMRNAVYGEPLPMDLIQRVCSRNRIEQTVSYPRAVLLNMYSEGVKQVRKQQGKKVMTDEEAIAFQYGRLLATYAKLQRAAQKSELANTNAVKCYATAGFSPVPMSHRLASGAKNHLAVLEGGLAQWFVSQLAQINSAIAELAQTTAIPTTFSIGAQAYFDLGFWSELNTNKSKAETTDE
ncbi:type I-C CRISPR-associated protein Cas8c/Csd1 [Coleofasciculus sp. E2-BRE-01]|uniref:type I-C CRISPR-associated protein Cas8c/Csd1 n=1 Tax=Coleofasciculus sp. E2-BRE-01 TaxID=3069524 RepID=UPI0032FDB6C8